MGVYIKGMSKPKNCGSCHFNKSDTHCFITKGKIDRDDYTCELECPIVEAKTPHGRLIDVTKIPYLETADPEVLELVGQAPTVIEAEVE